MSNPNLLVACKALVKVIRDFQCGDFSPIMDEIFDAEAAIRNTELALPEAQPTKKENQ